MDLYEGPYHHNNMVNYEGALVPARMVTESELVADLLFCLMGVPAAHVAVLTEYATGYTDFGYNSNIDPLHERLCKRILSAASNFSRICKFASTRHARACGRVSQALAGALDRFQRSYFLFLDELEKRRRRGELTLLRFQQDMQGMYDSMQVLVGILDNIDKLDTVAATTSNSSSKSGVKSGTILTILYEAARQPTLSSPIQTVLQELLHDACRPYFALLEDWVTQGALPALGDMTKSSASTQGSRPLMAVNYPATTPILTSNVGVPDEFMVRVNAPKSSSHSGGSSHSSRHRRGQQHNQQQQQQFEASDYWLKRFHLREDDIPSFLAERAKKILNAGKYLNVIQRCGKMLDEVVIDRAAASNGGEHHENFTARNPRAVENICFSMRARDYTDKIDAAYEYASSYLYNIIMHEYKLVTFLASVKHFLLLDQDDFMQPFFDLAEDALLRPKSEVDLGRIRQQLQQVLSFSALSHDPNRDRLSIGWRSIDLWDVLSCKSAGPSRAGTANAQSRASHIVSPPPSASSTHAASFGGGSAYQNPQLYENVPFKSCAVDCFSFDMKLDWPITLVLGEQNALAKYKFVFQALLAAKHIEWQLSRLWLQLKPLTSSRVLNQSQQTFTSPPRAGSATHAKHSQMLKFVDNMQAVSVIIHCMRDFVKSYQHYMMFEVIEPEWQAMASALGKRHDFNSVLLLHDAFVDSIIKKCLLMDRDFLLLLNNLFTICRAFYCFIDNELSEKGPAQPQQQPAVPSTTGGGPTKRASILPARSATENFRHNLECFQLDFINAMLKLLALTMAPEARAAGTQVLKLAVRLDSNGFYGNNLRRLAKLLGPDQFRVWVGQQQRMAVDVSSDGTRIIESNYQSVPGMLLRPSQTFESARSLSRKRTVLAGPV